MVGSPAWWLTHPHQFLVDDDAQRPIGVVDDVKAHPDTGSPHELVVVQGWGRRRVVIPIDAVAEIMPADRRLVVRRSTRQRWRRLERRQRGGLAAPLLRLANRAFSVSPPVSRRSRSRRT